VETERFGTIGIGTIYEWYRDGTINADDEVALVHGDEESRFQPLSEPLVNIRASMMHAVAEGLLNSEFGEKVIEIAQSLYYPNRLVSTILQRCRDLNFPASELRAVEQALSTGYVDLKKADARELLKRIADVLAGSVERPVPPRFEFSRSSVFETLYNLDRKIHVAGEAVSQQDIVEHVALNCPDFQHLRRSALDRSTVFFFGMLLGIRVRQDEIVAEREVFCDERGLNSPADLSQWLRSAALSESDLWEYLTQEAVCRRLRRWAVTARSFDRGSRALLDELRMRGVFDHWARETAEAAAIVAVYKNQPEYLNVSSEDPAALAGRLAAFGKARVKGDARLWAEDAGFDGADGLAEAIRRSVIFNDIRARISRQISALEQLDFTERLQSGES
jgi:hypothetical protein